MTYKYLTTGELIDELESYAAQITSLALQIEKLFKLRADGKISDIIYKELYEDIGKKVDVARMDRLDLSEASNGRVKEINSEVGELKYRLERLEARRMLDFISAEKYSAAKEELLKKVGDNDEVVLMISKLTTSTEEAFRKIDDYFSDNQPTTVFMPQAESARATTEGRGMATRQVQQPAQQLMQQPAQQLMQQDDVHEKFSVLSSAAMIVQDEMLCPRCQTANPRDAGFCFACGTKMQTSGKAESKDANTSIEMEGEPEKERVTPTPTSLHPEGRRRVHKDEALKGDSNGVSVQKCPKCGAENLLIAAYCYHCNSTLSGNEKEDDNKPKEKAWLGRP